MAWYDDLPAWFDANCLIDGATVEADWVAAAVDKVVDHVRPAGMVRTRNLRTDIQRQAEAYFRERPAVGAPNFAVWAQTKAAEAAARPVVPIAAARPARLTAVAPPGTEGPDAAFPVFSAAAVSAECAVGHLRWPKRRIKLRFHLLRNDHATAAQLTEAAKKRTLKWVRRVYAQANMAPKILGVDVLGEVPDNTLTVSGVRVPGYARPKLPSGVRVGGGASAVTLVLTDSADVAQTLRVPLVADATLAGVADAIRHALEAAGCAVATPVVPLSDASHLRSYDLIVSKHAQPLRKIVASHDDDRFGHVDGEAFVLANNQWVLEVPSFTPRMDGEDGLHGGSPMQRKLLRLGASHDDQLDLYVLAQGSISGRAYPVYDELIGGPTEPAAPYRNAGYLSYWSTDAKGAAFDNQLEVSPFTLPHEIGHVLASTAHTGAEGCLMGGSWSKDDSLLACRRIYSKPLLVGSLDFRTETPRDGQDLAAEMHARGNKNILEPW